MSERIIKMPTLQLAIDARAAQAGANQFVQATGQIKNGAGQASDSINKLGNSTDVVMGAFKKLAVYFSAGAIFKYVISEAMEAEKVQHQLAAALDLTGSAADSALRSLNDFASQMERLTVYSDEQIKSQMAYAKNLGVSTNQLDDAAIAAAGLAAKYRMDLASAMQLIGRASQGQTQMLSRYGIVLDETLSPQEKFNELLKIGADNFRLAADETQTAAGAWEQFKNALGNTAELFGNMLPTNISGAADALNLFNQRFEEMNAEAAKFTESGTSLGAAFKGLTVPLALMVDLGETFYGMIVATADVLILIPGLILEGIDKAANGIETLNNKLADTWVGKKIGMGHIDIDTTTINAWSKGFEEEQNKLHDKAEYFMLQRQSLTQKVFDDMMNPPYMPKMDIAIGNLKDSAKKDILPNEKLKPIYDQDDVNALNRMTEGIDKQLEFLKRLNNARGESADYIKLQMAAEKAYGKNSEQTLEIMDKYKSKLSEIEQYERLQDIARGIGDSFSNAFERMIFEGEKFQDVLRDMAAEIVKTAAKKALLDPLGEALGMGMMGILGGLFGFSKGGVISDGEVTPYAYGGVVNSPTYFPMARGYGLMGEAGPEAVMPLTRINGKLGVMSSTGEKQNMIPPNVIINNNTGTQLKQDGQPKFDGKNWVVNIVAENIDNYGILYQKTRGNC